MGKHKNLTNQLFGSLLVLKKVGSKNKKSLWLVRCIVEWCGEEIEVQSDQLKSETRPRKHCGCLSSKHRSDALRGNTNSVTHGQCKTLEYYKERNHRRRLKSKNQSCSILSYEESFKQSRAKLDYCVYCGLTDKLTTDHIIPIDKNGNQNPKNLVTACRSCNASKHNLFFIDWYIKTKRCKRSLTEIIIDMGFDSIHHLQNYQDSICPDHIEQNLSMVVAKLLKAERKSIRSLDRYYRSLDHYPTH